MGQLLSVVFFGALAVWFGMTVFRTSSMVRSALSLLATMAALGAIFLALEAEFLGVLQLMMMATEMSIMAIFMVMYMMDPGGLGMMDMSHQKRASRTVGVLGALGAGVIAFLVNWGAVADAIPDPTAQIQALGNEIMGRSMIIFETAGVAILTAMIAATAIAIARRE
jgi:NADH-quinone oxidoreductase subunit J